MNLIKTFAFGSIFALSLSTAMAQVPVHGTASASAGFMDATPWEADIQLAIPTEHVFLTPYLSVEGITPTSSETEEDNHLIYSKSQNRYESSEILKNKGFDLKYGTQAILPFRDGDLIMNLSFDGRTLRQFGNGTRYERLTDQNNLLLGDFSSRLHMPKADANMAKAKAGLKFRFGMQIEYAYSYNSSTDVLNQWRLDGTPMAGANNFETNRLKTDTKVHNHLAKLTQTFNLKNHQIFFGGSFEFNKIERDNSQIFNREACFSGGQLDHKYLTGSDFIGYRFHNKHIQLSAQVTSAVTYMSGRHTAFNINNYDPSLLQPTFTLPEAKYSKTDKPLIQDWIPQFQFKWNVGNGDTLKADYRMIIKRPEAELLDPTHILGTLTDDYGNLTLEGIHINNIVLAYQIAREKFSYTTRLNGIIVEDGFNAIWIDKNNIRNTTWGNQGVRRAYSVTPDLMLRPSDKTTLTASATLMWDKRIARAIHMAKEHWGIRTQVGIKQVLPQGFLVNLRAAYSEGNTFDLYSHEGSKWEGNASIIKSLLANRLQLSFSYNYEDYDKLILTQGAYTGKITRRMESHNSISLKAAYSF